MRPGMMCLTMLGIASLAACAESATLPSARSAPAPVHDLTGGDGAEDPLNPVRIKDAYLSIGFPINHVYPGYADIYLNMLYDSYHASLRAEAVLSGSQTISRSYGPVERHTSTFFNNIHTTTFHMLVTTPCGNSLQAGANFDVWWLASATEHSDERTEFREKEIYQPACAPTGGGGGGTGGGSSLRLCSTTSTDYYWYYPDTGQVEYRYSDSSMSCETMY